MPHTGPNPNPSSILVMIVFECWSHMGRVVMLIGFSQPTTWEERIGEEREGKKCNFTSSFSSNTNYGNDSFPPNQIGGLLQIITSCFINNMNNAT